MELLLGLLELRVFPTPSATLGLLALVLGLEVTVLLGELIQLLDWVHGAQPSKTRSLGSRP